MRRGALVTALAAAVVVGAAPVAAWAGPVTDWQMNESSGSRTMTDSSGSGLHGSIGADVVLQEPTPNGGRAYRFRGDWWVVNDERLVTVGDDPRLDPGTQPYAATIRLKTGAVDSNVIQKGQTRQSGGYWKIEVHDGWPRCHFQDGSGGRKAIGFIGDSRPETKVADGDWHTLRCERLSNGVRITMDPGEPTSVTKFLRGTVGNIDNKRPLVIGGKIDCDRETVTCDYFAGAVDWVTIDRPGVS